MHARHHAQGSGVTPLPLMPLSRCSLPRSALVRSHSLGAAASPGGDSEHRCGPDRPALRDGRQRSPGVSHRSSELEGFAVKHSSSGKMQKSSASRRAGSVC